MMKQISVDIGGTTYSISSDDAYLDNLAAGFEPQTVKLINSLTRPGDIALDIGANIGCTTLLLSQKAAQVHAFEPSPSTYSFGAQHRRQIGHHHVQLRPGRRAG
jgi:tRNA1(Val) A37 N6-methylase TrmN6